MAKTYKRVIIDKDLQGLTLIEVADHLMELIDKYGRNAKLNIRVLAPSNETNWDEGLVKIDLLVPEIK